MSATIKIFHVGNKSFRHVMSSELDLVELRDEDDKTILTYCADSKVFDQHGRLGKFCLEYVDGQPRWVFCETPIDACVVLGPDLPSAAVEFSKRYLRQLFSVHTGQSPAMLQPA